VENGSIPTECKWNGGVANRRVAQVKKFIVPPHYFVMEWEVVHSRPKIPRIAVLAIQSRSSDIKLQGLRKDHGGGLHLESVTENRGKTRGTRAFEVVEPAQEVFSVQGKAVVLETSVKVGHLVGHIGNYDARPKNVGCEDDGAVFEANLGVLELVTVGLFLRVLVAASEVGTEASANFS
jgi:hypothetical protein